MVVLNPMLMHVHAVCFRERGFHDSRWEQALTRGRRQRAPGQVVVLDAE